MVIKRILKIKLFRPLIIIIIIFFYLFIFFFLIAIDWNF